jgi:hypothetical protein
MAQNVERTALAEFYLEGKLIRPGQVVSLNAIQLKKLSAAQVVYEDEALNADVPVAKLPDPDAPSAGGDAPATGGDAPAAEGADHPERKAAEERRPAERPKPSKARTS